MIQPISYSHKVKFTITFLGNKHGPKQERIRLSLIKLSHTKTLQYSKNASLYFFKKKKEILHNCCNLTEVDQSQSFLAELVRRAKWHRLF